MYFMIYNQQIRIIKFLSFDIKINIELKPKSVPDSFQRVLGIMQVKNL